MDVGRCLVALLLSSVLVAGTAAPALAEDPTPTGEPTPTATASETPTEPPPAPVETPTVTETVTVTETPAPVDACGLDAGSACFVTVDSEDPSLTAWAVLGGLTLLLLAGILAAQLRRP